MAAKKFEALPVIFCKEETTVYILPVKLDKLKNRPTKAEYAKSVTVHFYKKLLEEEPEVAKLYWNKVEKLEEENKLPQFIDVELCKKFLNRDSVVEKFCNLENSQAPQRTNQERTRSIIEEEREAEREARNREIKIERETEENITTVEEVEEIDSPLKMSDGQMDQKTGNDFNRNETPKIKISEWKDIKTNGDPLDWLRTALFIIRINRGTLTDGAVIQHLLGAITATELRMKIINELAKEKEEEITVNKFEDIFKANVKRDTITYRNDLKKLRYTEDCNMREFYARITNLVSKAMELDENKDKISIMKLACNEFITKIPNDIKQALQTHVFKTGEEMADQAEKIRSYQRLYLPQKLDINHIQNNNRGNMGQPRNNGADKSILCFRCGKYGHKAKDCRSKDTRDNNKNNYKMRNAAYEQRNNAYRGRNEGNNRSEGNRRDNNNRYENRQNNGPRSNNRNPDADKTCYNCNKKGHIAKNCWSKKSQKRYTNNMEIEDNYNQVTDMMQRLNIGGRGPAEDNNNSDRYQMS